MSTSGRQGGQAQRAGAESVQIQAAGDIHIGISEERARQISLQMAEQVVAEYAGEANQLIQERIVKLDDRIIASLIRENRLEIFADPGFQRTYRKAQEGAAASERDADYELLAALLLDRAERGPQRPIRAGIERSIEIIDRIDDEALRGLTVLQAVQQYRPAGGIVDKGLQVMDRLLGQLLDGPLPAGDDWLDHLDILDAVRIDQVNKFKKFSDFWPAFHMPVYMSAGAEEADVPPVWTDGTNVIPWTPPLVEPHDFKPGFLRIGAATGDGFKNYFAKSSKAMQDAISDEAATIFRMNEIDESCREPLMQLVRARPRLQEIEAWWDAIPKRAEVTAVGRVLARANAERLDTQNVLPPLS
ncbi:MAG: LPO_1073/Vpar_1526 family protein [Rhodoglobus sp.]